MKAKIIHRKYEKIVFALALVLLILFTGCANNTTGNAVLDKGDTSLSDVKERGKLLVGICSSEPMQYTDEDTGEIYGFEIDMIKRIASGIGVDAELVKLGWPELFNSIDSGEIDISVCITTITQKRQENYLFSVPYFNAGQVIVVREENEDIKRPEDLAGKKVAAYKGTTSEKAAKRYVNSSLLIIYDDDSPFPEDETVAAEICDYLPCLVAVKKDPLLKIAGEPFTQEYYGIVSNLNSYALMDEVNRILREMKREGELKELENRWLR